MTRLSVPRLPSLRRRSAGAPDDAPARGRIAVLQRRPGGDDGTPGVLALPDGPSLHTIEPPWRENRANRSCIPAGEYAVHPHRSPRFGECLVVAAVPRRSHILFHAGNIAGDVELGLRTHSRGCILPGGRAGTLAVGDRRQRAVLASRPALRALLAWAGLAPFEISIRNAA